MIYMCIHIYIYIYIYIYIRIERERERDYAYRPISIGIGIGIVNMCMCRSIMVGAPLYIHCTNLSLIHTYTTCIRRHVTNINHCTSNTSCNASHYTNCIDLPCYALLYYTGERVLAGRTLRFRLENNRAGHDPRDGSGHLEVP